MNPLKKALAVCKVEVCTAVIAMSVVILLLNSIGMQSDITTRNRRESLEDKILNIEPYKAELVNYSIHHVPKPGPVVKQDPPVPKKRNPHLVNIRPPQQPSPNARPPQQPPVDARPPQHSPVNARPPQQPPAGERPTPQPPNNNRSNFIPIRDSEITEFTRILEARLSQIEADLRIASNKTCASLALKNDVRSPCIDTTCPRKFPKSPEARIRQLMLPQLRLTYQQQNTVNTIAADVKPMKYIFATAASSNHYKESQALIHNMRQFVFNRLKRAEYIFYYFDLGLKPIERKRVEKNCNCVVKTVPISTLSGHLRRPNCYVWKPLIIKALLRKADVLVYADTSIRFQDMDMDKFFATARRWGAQFLTQRDSIPNHTLESMFTFYEDLPCMYAPFPELLAGFSVFHNETFMEKVMIDPWVACALNRSCMCPVDDPNTVRNCPHVERKVGQCHRFDLSALTIQFAKLYGDKIGHLVMQTNKPPKLRRNEVMDFFKD